MYRTYTNFRGPASTVLSNTVTFNSRRRPSTNVGRTSRRATAYRIRSPSHQTCAEDPTGIAVSETDQNRQSLVRCSFGKDSQWRFRLTSLQEIARLVESGAELNETWTSRPALRQFSEFCNSPALETRGANRIDVLAYVIKIGSNIETSPLCSAAYLDRSSSQSCC